jgi:hypothetical protein
MGDVRPLTSFSERIKWLIQRNTRFGGTGVVQRWKVEEIGTNLGMSKVAACEQFLSLQGNLWDVYTSSVNFDITNSSATRHLEPARRWLAINDVTVLGL